MTADKVCGTCRYHVPAKTGGFICVCMRSRLCAEETGEDESCGEWKEVMDDQGGSGSGSIPPGKGT